MKNITRKIMKRISKINLNYKTERVFHNFKGKNINKNVKYIDTKILVIDHVVKIRIFIPKKITQTIIYYHGGGFVVGNVINYSQVCSNLAYNTSSLVISIDYRLAPEYPFPCGLIDCYNVTKYLFSDDSILDDKNIIIMGDSAGGNIASVISIIASEEKEFKINKQILLYPLTYHIHNEKSKFASIRENGEDYILTNEKINNYLNLYVKNKEDLSSKYVSPLNADELYNQPDTLIITALLDPLRDEAEAYGRKLKKFDNKVKICRINSIHGFFSLPFSRLEKSYKIINKFIKDGDTNAKKMV